MGTRPDSSKLPETLTPPVPAPLTLPPLEVGPAGSSGREALPRSAAIPRTAAWFPETQASVPGSEERPIVLPDADLPGYEILGELGRGGMGVVYQGRQIHLKRLVALKMMRTEWARPEELARFRSEAEAVARLSHPNIVQIYEIGHHRGAPFFSLEYMDGGSLDRRLRGSPQPPRDSAALVRTIALAMQAAHEKNIIHRDLKPANILLATGSRIRQNAGEASPHSGECGYPLADCVPKVSDFGLAKQLDDDSGQTVSGAVMGTPSYMAPEQAEGRLEDIGPWTDTYALGAVLYECLTGRPPFKAATISDTLLLVRTQDPVPPSRLAAGVPRDLETICLKCLHKEEARRYASALELADDLGRYLDGQPIRARRVGAWERSVKWARRRPAVAALAVTALLTVLAAAAGGLFYGLYKDQQATALGQRLERSQLAHEGWERGQTAEAAGDYQEAKQHYDQARATLDADGEFADAGLRGRLAEGSARALGKLKEQQTRQRQAVDLAAEREDFQKRGERFGRHRDEVLFHAVTYRDQDAAANAAAVRREAAAALVAIQLPVPLFSPPLHPGERGREEGDGLMRWGRAARPEELKQLAAECYHLLLVWAEAETDQPPQALRLLDAAAVLAKTHGLATPRTFHLRRAAVLDHLDKVAARTERDLAAKVLVLHPLDHFQTALDDYRAGKIEQAAASCARVLRENRNHLWALYLEALCSLQEKRWISAIVALTECIDRRPGFVLPLALRGVAHAELKEYATAAADFKQALAKAGADPAARGTVLTSRSAMYLRRKRWKDARSDLLEATQLQPDAYPGYVNLARACQALGKRPEAIAALTRALKLHPSAALYSMRGQILREEGKPAAAQSDFEQVVALEPAASERQADAHVKLAQLKHQAGKYQDALKDCNDALVAAPNLTEAHRQRAETLLALRQSEEAGKALDRYLELKERDPNVLRALQDRDAKILRPLALTYQARGILHTNGGDHAKAIESYTRTIALHADAKTLSYRGWAYLNLEAPRLAALDFDAALKLAAKDSDALSGRGMAGVLLARTRAATDAEKAARETRAATADADAALQQGKPGRQLLLVCGRVHAWAVQVLEATARSADRAEALRCRQRTVELLGAALEQMSSKERSDFWRKTFPGDVALRALRNSEGILELIRKFPG